MQNTNTNSGISIQVSLSGYSFKVEGDHGSGRWLSGAEMFTTPEFQKRYGQVRISLLTHKCTLVPEQFFDSKEAGRMLSDVVKTGDNDIVDYIRVEQFGAVLIFSNSIGETLSRAISQSVLT